MNNLVKKFCIILIIISIIFPVFASTAVLAVEDISNADEKVNQEKSEISDSISNNDIPNENASDSDSLPKDDSEIDVEPPDSQDSDVDNESNNSETVDNTNNDIIEKIYMILAEKEEISERDMVSLYEEKNEILDIYANQAIREDVNQVVRIVNRTYRINEMNFQWKQRLNENKKSISKQLKGVSKAISDIAVDLSKNKDNIFEKQEIEIKELMKQKSILAK